MKVRHNSRCGADSQEDKGHSVGQISQQRMVHSLKSTPPSLLRIQTNWGASQKDLIFPISTGVHRRFLESRSKWRLPKVIHWQYLPYQNVLWSFFLTSVSKTKVYFNDIKSRGFSFFTKKLPIFKFIVILLKLLFSLFWLCWLYLFQCLEWDALSVLSSKMVPKNHRREPVSHTRGLICSLCSLLCLLKEPLKVLCEHLHEL